MELRKAMPVHHTDVTDEKWDAGANVKRIPDDAGAKVLKQMYAWMDPEGDPDKKSSYKLPHHMVDSDGNVGAANMKACSAAIGALNGARGGVDIPEEDRKAVWKHLAAHMMDGDMEPPEMMNSFSEGIERRAFPFMEIRVDSGEQPKIVGHAAVFDKLSVNLGGFREKIAPGAFANAIKKNDIRALWNHDPNFVLGRNKSKTLTLAEDEKGLAIEIVPPDAQWAKDLMETIRRGDVDQMSFGFRVIKDTWEFIEGKDSIRTLQEVELFDVSPVTFPAYPQTDVKVRSILAGAGLDFDALSGLIFRAQRGLPLRSADRDLIAAAIRVLNSYLPEVGQEPRSDEAEKRAQARLAILRKRLEIADKSII